MQWSWLWYFQKLAQFELKTGMVWLDGNYWCFNLWLKNIGSLKNFYNLALIHVFGNVRENLDCKDNKDTAVKRLGYFCEMLSSGRKVWSSQHLKSAGEKRNRPLSDLGWWPSSLLIHNIEESSKFLYEWLLQTCKSLSQTWGHWSLVNFLK